MSHVKRVACLPAHPLGKRLVMHQQLCGVSTRRQPLGLRFGGRVQKAHGDRVEPWGRGRSDDLGDRNRIAGQQQVPPGALQLDCPPHGHLRGLLTPDPCHRRGQRSEMQQLDALDLR